MTFKYWILTAKMGRLSHAIKASRSRIKESSSSSSHCNILGRNGIKVVGLKRLRYFENLDLTLHDLFLNPVYVDTCFVFNFDSH